MKKKRGGFVRGAALMMAGTFIAKLIGACFRIPLTNVLGAEGMGVYQLIYPVYSILLTSSSGALPLAVSVLVAARLTNEKQDDARALISSAMSALLMIGLVLTAALVLLSGVIGRLQGSADTAYGYIAIAPAIVFVSGIAVLKGWFQGTGNMVPSTLSQLTEAAFKLGVGLTLAYFLRPKGIAVAVAGAFAGVTASEVLTFVILLMLYRRKNPKLELAFDFKTAKTRYKEIVAISVPITVGGIIFPLTQLIDSFLVVNILARAVGTAAATVSYGLFTGPVNSLINLPIVLGLSIGVAVVPQLSKNKELRDLAAIRLKTSTAVKAALLVGVPFAVLYLAVPLPILRLLYPALSVAELTMSATLLRIGAVSIIALSLMQIFTSILQGLQDTRSPVINMAVAGGVKIILDVVLLYTIGIIGVAVASLAAYVFAAVLNGAALARLMGPDRQIYKNSGIIILAGVIMGAVVFTVWTITRSVWWSLGATAAGLIGFFAAVGAFHIFGEKELLCLPFGNKLAGLGARKKLQKEKQ